MGTTVEEKRALIAFGCENYQNTIKRLCTAAALTPNAEAKALFCGLTMQLSEEVAEKDYSIFINGVCMEMEIYDFAVWMLKRQITEV